MEAKLKIVVSEVLLFSFIGFLIYLLAIGASFIGSRLGLASGTFDQVVLALSVSGIAAFGICSYFTCFRSKSTRK